MEKRYNSIQEETQVAIAELTPIIKRCDEGQVMTIMIQSYANAKNMSFIDAQIILASHITSIFPSAAEFYMNEKKGV